jgi:hypothetical protein
MHHAILCRAKFTCAGLTYAACRMWIGIDAKDCRGTRSSRLHDFEVVATLSATAQDCVDQGLRVRLCLKSRNSVCAAPTARNTVARGKRRASEARRPWVERNYLEALKERNKRLGSRHFAPSVLFSNIPFNQGRRASLCSALAPGYLSSHLRRSDFHFQTFEAKLTTGVARH